MKVSEVMEQLKTVRTDRQAQRAILRRCPVNFLKEMCEVMYLQGAGRLEGIQPGHEKKCYLDLLTAVSAEDLPLARLERDVYARKDWLVTREVEREYLAEWQEYMNVPYKGYGVID